MSPLVHIDRVNSDSEASGGFGMVDCWKVEVRAEETMRVWVVGVGRTLDLDPDLFAVFVAIEDHGCRCPEPPWLIAVGSCARRKGQDDVSAMNVN